MTSSLRGRRVALIGGAGFVGHHLALSLAAAGVDVHVIDSLQVNNLLAFAGAADSPRRELDLRIINQRLDLLRAARVPIHTQDARDYHALSRILSGIHPQVIVHLAAVAHADRSNKDPYSTFDHSLRTLENALDYARREPSRVEHFVFLSSSMVYGHFLTDEVDEDQPLNPIGIYAALKVAGEKMVIAYQQVFGLPFTIVRPSALYGPRCVSRRVVQLFIENAVTGAPLCVQGDGSQRLDFTYIEDLVHGLHRTLGNPRAMNQTFNMTFGASRSVADLVEVLRREFPTLQVASSDTDRLVPMRGTLSVRRAVEAVGYAPEFPLEIGVPRYVEWYRSIDMPATALV